MKRRAFISLLGGAAAAWPLAAHPQSQPKMLQVGFVGIQPRLFYTAFLGRMAELGYEEGRNFTFEYIQAANVDDYEKNYRELAARKVDVFLAVGNEPASCSPLGRGWWSDRLSGHRFRSAGERICCEPYTSGGNVTGIFVRQLELAAKRAEIAREVFRAATIVGIAFDTVSREQRDAAAEAARKLGFEPRMIEVKGPQDYDGAFSAMDGLRDQPIILPAGPMFLRDRDLIAQVLLERRIPSIAAFREKHCGRGADELWF